MTIKNLVDSFLEEIEKIRRYSSQTCRAYRNDLYQFLNYCSESGREDIKSISEKIIRKFIVNLNEQKLSGTSVSRKLSSLRSFFEYLLKYNYISSSPLSGIINPKTRRNLPEVISFEEFQKIPEEIEKVKNIRTRKESSIISVDNSKLFLAIVEMLYGCALRVSELCSLNVGDIDANNNSVRVIGKGSKIRIVPVGNETLKILNQYLLTRNKLNSRSPLFITSGGNRLYSRYV